MNTMLNRIESEEIVIYTESTYSIEILNKCRDIFGNLVTEGKITGNFDDNEWIGYSGVKKYVINFEINDVLFYQHIGKEFGITVETMKLMVRCYAISCIGTFIFRTVAEKVNVVKTFLENFKNSSFILPYEDIWAVEDFLGFINTPERQIQSILSQIKKQGKRKKSQRTLKPIINYLAIENEINYMYSKEIDEESFKKWFPIFFWVNITFILPLRATEMLVTPRNCILREKGKVYIRVRRTKLKKGNRAVYYDVEKDYKIYTYEIPDNAVVKAIEEYFNLTSMQDRRFIFEYNKFMTNEILSLQAFNNLVEEFVTEKIIGNSRYDYVKYALGIEEFEAVTAGDSRPIAMANLYFQNTSADICRQLADHVNIDTSAGYYTNVSEIIFNSSIMQYQKKINAGITHREDEYAKALGNALDTGKAVCLSQKRIVDKENLDDCINEGHLQECLGCKYYIPTQKELDAFLDENKRKADDRAIEVIKYLNDTSKLKDNGVNLEELLLEVYTYASTYRMGCDCKAKEVGEEWQKHKNSQMNSY